MDTILIFAIVPTRGYRIQDKTVGTWKMSRLVGKKWKFKSLKVQNNYNKNIVDYSVYWKFKQYVSLYTYKVFYLELHISQLIIKKI